MPDKISIIKTSLKHTTMKYTSNVGTALHHLLLHLDDDVQKICHFCFQTSGHLTSFLLDDEALPWGSRRIFEEDVFKQLEVIANQLQHASATLRIIRIVSTNDECLFHQPLAQDSRLHLLSLHLHATSCLPLAR